MSLDASQVSLSGSEQGGVFPTSQQALLRVVRLEAGAKVAGGIVCGRLEVKEGGCWIGGAVFSTGEVELIPRDGGVEVDAPLAARAAVLLDGSGGRIVVAGDISAPRIMVQDAIVFGSLLGDRIVVRNSVVLGAVEASQGCQLFDSYVGAVGSGEVKCGGSLLVGTTCLLARSGFEVVSGGRVFSAALCDLQRVAEGDVEEAVAALVEMDFRDIQVLHMAAAGELEELWHVLTLGKRAMDLRSYEGVGTRNQRLFALIGHARHLSQHGHDHRSAGLQLAEGLKKLVERAAGAGR